MKITIQKDHLSSALQRIQGISGSRSTLPILSNVLWETDTEKVWLTATDLEMSLRISVPAQVAKAGSTTLPAKPLFNIVRELSEPQLELESDEQHSTSITSGSAFFKILGLPPEDFPALPQVESDVSHALDQAVFRGMLEKTAYAASTDETRQFLNGVLLSFRDDKVTAVATDGRRLALFEQELEIPKGAECELIVPSKTVAELLRGLKEEGAVRIRQAKTQAAFECGDLLILSKLIEGPYPNYRQVIPAQAEHRISVDRESLLAAVRRVSLLTNESTNSIRMSFSKNKLTVSAESPNIGEARESLPVKFAGPTLNIGFNPDYVMDPLKHLPSDEIFLEITDEIGPAVFKCDLPFLYVLMPMRLD